MVSDLYMNSHRIKSPLNHLPIYFDTYQPSTSLSTKLRGGDDSSKFVKSYLKLKKIPKLLNVITKGVSALYSEFYIYLISSTLYNITWLTQITKMSMIITFTIMLIYIYRELRNPYLEGRYLIVGKKKRPTSSNDWSPLRQRYIKFKS